MLREVRGIDDTPMPATCVGVIIVETAIIIALWLIGRAFN